MNTLFLNCTLEGFDPPRQGKALQRVFCLPPRVNKQGGHGRTGLWGQCVCVLSSWQNISIQVWAVQVRWLDCDRHPTWPPDTIHSKLSEVCAKEIHGSSSSNQNIKKCKFCYLQHSTFAGSVDLWELLKLKIKASEMLVAPRISEYFLWNFEI